MPKINSKNGTAKSLSRFLADRSHAVDQRRELLRMAHDEALDEILKVLEHKQADAVHQEKLEELDRLLEELNSGPLRPGLFHGSLPPEAGGSHLAEVRLDDGTTAYTVVPDPNLATSLCIGERVLLDRQAKALLRRAPSNPQTGEEATLERCLDQGCVEVSYRGNEQSILRCAQTLRDKIAAGEVEPGATLLVNHHQKMAHDVIPPADGLAHYSYLEKTPPPDVLAQRDMGAPPRVIAEAREYFRLEMSQPALRRRFRLPRSLMLLFSGVAGSGKTMSLMAIWRILYEEMSKVTGLPIDDLPPRVFTLRLSRILNSLLGQSDKNVARFFAEIEQLAATPFVTPDGREFELPVLAVIEEIDGLATQRGRDHSGIHDRILTTVLQLLDPSRSALRNKPILFIGTTNEAQQVDAAFLRRIGGTVVSFGRLNRRAFEAVLRKRLTGLPIAPGDHTLPDRERERALQSELAAWLYSPNGSDPGMVELSFVGSSNSEIRYRRDFLNGALVDRAVNQACSEAAAEAARQDEKAPGPGIDLPQLVRAFDAQIRSVVDQLDAHNVHRFLDLPDAVRVASVRRLAPPPPSPLELQHR